MTSSDAIAELRKFFRPRCDHHRLCMMNAPKSTPPEKRRCDCYASDDVRAHELIDAIEHSRGERHGIAKLTDAQAAEIRRRAAKGEKKAALAREFGVSRTIASRAANGDTYR